MTTTLETNVTRLPERTRTHDRVVSYTAGDGMPNTLINVRGEAEPTRGPVVLVHGAGVRGEIFRAPVRQTLVDALVEAGYDVWLENWRASTDVPANLWDLDQAAKYDHPSAIRRVVEETGADSVQAIIHCQGSTSFAMSVLAGLVPEVKTVISNAVSLHPVIPNVSRIKMRTMLPVTRPFLKYMDPQWGERPPHLLAKSLNAFITTIHRECDNNVCRWSSFTYGVGFPTLWRHENLNDATHDWLRGEFGPCPRTFFEQMMKCLDAGRLISLGKVEGLPRDFTADPQTDARFALFAGEQNRCFLPVSQTRTHHYLERRGLQSSLHVIPNYGHLDIFMGQTAAEDVFPLMLRELD